METWLITGVVQNKKKNNNPDAKIYILILNPLFWKFNFLKLSGKTRLASPWTNSESRPKGQIHEQNIVPKHMAMIRIIPVLIKSLGGKYRPFRVTWRTARGSVRFRGPIWIFKKLPQIKVKPNWFNNGSMMNVIATLICIMRRYVWIEWCFKVIGSEFKVQGSRMMLKKQITCNNASKIQTQSLLSLNPGITARRPQPFTHKNLH